MPPEIKHGEFFLISLIGKDYKFEFDSADDTYKWGTSNNGVGVYLEGKWVANTVFNGNIEFIESEPNETLTSFSERCIKTFLLREVLES